MENEVSSMVSLGTMLVSVALVLSLVWFTVSMGNNIKGNAYMEASEVKNSVATSQLISIKDKDAILMPKAAIYAMLSEESNSIESINYKQLNAGNQVTTVKPGSNMWEAKGVIQGKYLSPEDIFEDNLTGKALIEATKGTTGSYVITVVDVA